MNLVEASYVKQNFGEVLARARGGEALGVRRHGQVVAALVPADWVGRQQVLDERRAARLAQQQVEQERLTRHQRVGIELLCAGAAEQARRIRAAAREVDRWEALGLCSSDYIRRWREWLALPVKKLVPLMVSAAEGWGPAMRQNSPFTVAAT